MIGSRKKNRTASRRGIASVELAVVAPVLTTLMFGIVELGLMFHSFQQLRSVAREGARQAAVGATPAEIQDRMLAVAGILDPNELSATLEHRGYWGDGTWGQWTALGSDGYNNTAPAGSHVRVSVTYNHHLVLPGLFGRFADDDAGEGIKVFQTQVTMRRE